MQKNYEKLIEYIINDEKEKAQELFHQIVVESSRDIYNQIVSEEESEDSEEEAKEEKVDEQFDDVDEVSTDQTDDMIRDIAADEQGIMTDDENMDMPHDEAGEMSDDLDDMGMDIDASDDDSDAADQVGSEEDLEDRVVDLEDEIERLKSEFEQLMSDEAGEPEHQDMPEEGVVREYTEKVSVTHTDGTDSKGAKSPVAGKNDMGGTAKNIAQGSEEKGSTTPKSQDMGAVDPRKAGKSAFTKKAPAPVAKDQAAGTKSPVAK